LNKQEILHNAPTGATHFIRQTLRIVYFKFDTHFTPLHWCNHKENWRRCRFFDFQGIKSLEDTLTIFNKDERIAELENKNASRRELWEILQIQAERIAGLETVTKIRKMFIANARTLGYPSTSGLLAKMLLKEKPND
jgi:hypothetical protein|tara:strand:- start:79 stop:489 length:411 start_codon:yes stop_codon:yes gene_type:complete